MRRTRKILFLCFDELAARIHGGKFILAHAPEYDLVLACGRIEIPRAVIVLGRRLGFAEVMEQSGLFLVYAVHLPDRDQGGIRRALLDEVAKARVKSVDATELAKAKNQLTAGYVFGLLVR